MDFRSKLQAYADQRLTAPELIIALDRAIADSHSRRDLLQNEVETFKRDVALQ